MGHMGSIPVTQPCREEAWGPEQQPEQRSAPSLAQQTFRSVALEALGIQMLIRRRPDPCAAPSVMGEWTCNQQLVQGEGQWSLEGESHFSLLFFHPAGFS